MPNIQQPKRQPEFVNGKRSTVVGVSPAHLYAVAWVDAEGQKSSCLCVTFGTDNEDGGLGVFILADQGQMEEQLKMPNQIIKKGLRAWVGSQTDSGEAEVPASNLVAEEVGKAIEAKTGKAPKQLSLNAIKIG
jgi:hypothetical protein